MVIVVITTKRSEKGMDCKIVAVSEGTDIDTNGHFLRYKKVRFTVNSGEHTLRISMPDFDRGKTNELVAAESKKIQAIYGKK